MNDTNFPPDAIACLTAAYPEQVTPLTHRLAEHALFEPEALAELADYLPEGTAMAFRGDVPVDVTYGGTPRNGMTVPETIRSIATNKSWVVLKSVENHPDYGKVLDRLLAEIEAVVLPRTGPMLRREAFIFVSSPGSMTPFHFDPEHNILMQISGEKTMSVFPQDDERISPGTAHEAYQAAGDYALGWQDAFEPLGQAHVLKPGDALYVPVKAPHFVRNGSEPSISLSITWRSHWSFNEADAHAMNAILRRAGISPGRPGRWPHRNLAKAYGYRVLRKIGAAR